MWEIKIIKGSNVGQSFSLSEGVNTIGRGQDSDVRIPCTSMSRKHFQISIQPNMVTIKDMNSRNGTFVNGVMIKQSRIKNGDKISVHQTVLEFMKSLSSNERQGIYKAPNDLPNSIPNSPYSAESSESKSFSESQSKPANLKTSLENIFMQGIYKIAEWGEFKWVVGCFIAGYIAIVTVLSVMPMINISKERIQKESLLRANDIGQRLASRYKSAQSRGLDSSFSINETRSEGVDQALIISATDGHIIAPSKLSGDNPDLPFVHKARRNNTATSDMIDNSTIGVSIPIQQLNSTGVLTVSAFAIIIYDMGDRVFKTDDVVRLVVQVLAFAAVLGFILFVMLMNLVEKPITDINRQLDHALKDGQKNVSHKFNFPILQKLITNINSSLSRIGEESESSGDSFGLTASDEASNLVSAIDIPTLVVDNTRNIIAINQACENLIGANDGILMNQNIGEISDQSLLLNLKDLISQSESDPHQVFSNKLEFSSIEYDIKITTVVGTDSIKYFVITINRELEEGL